MGASEKNIKMYKYNNILTKELLEKMYIADQLKPKQIAKLVGCNIKTVNYWLYKHKVVDKKGHKLIVGVNDFSTLRPDLAQQWHPEKNGNKQPKDFTIGSDKKIWWVDELGHEWLADINRRVNRGSGCPYCAGKRVLIGFNDLITTHPQLCKQWSPKNQFGPEMVSKGSKKIVIWVDEIGHEWKASVLSRTHGNGCPYCASNIVLVGFNDLATKRPDLIKEWNYEKNINILPTQFTQCSGKKVWWKCLKCGNEWVSTISNRFNGCGCPRCSKSQLEKSTHLVLDKLFIKCEPQYTSTRCKYKKSLPFDFYLPEYNCCIECQGIQHYPKEFKKSHFAQLDWTTNDQLIAQNKRDKIKRNFCKKNKIKLIYIKYDEIDKIEEILIRELNLQGEKL